MSLDLSYLEARTLVISRAYNSIRFIQVGVGGTGSWLAPHLARLAKIISDTTSKTASVKFIDHDVIENANLDRQNFCAAELGLNKAQALALRYGLATGLDITAIPEPFKTRHVWASHDELVILIGCVDNAEARRNIADCLKNSSSYGPTLFWLDCGNYRSGGNVLIGNTEDPERLRSSFAIDGWCTALPSPTLQHPELLEPMPEELPDHNLSCEELALRSAQSLTVNQTIAAVASTYLVSFLSGKLRSFQTYVNLDAMVTKSTYISPQNIAKVLDKPDFFEVERKVTE